ncbi:type IX secretion system membrane protein PorP/SprF, partial [bacterium]|nr:type IX secretion system membrane protein PorP/SprF [bacterium]
MSRRLFYPVRLVVSFLAMAGCIYLPAWSAFELERPGARPSGMSGAFCALADDADALNYNPAGLAGIFSRTFSFNYAKLLSGMDDGALADSRFAYLQPLKQVGTIGIAWYQRNLADLYQENVVNLAYGFPLDSKGDFLLGGALKILHQAYLDTEATGQNSYFNYDTSVMGYCFDLGGLIRITDHLSTGLSLLNFNQPNLTLANSAKSQIPMQVRLGVGYQQNMYTGVLECLWHGQDFRFSAGGEVWWFERLLGTRLGISLGDGDMLELTAGLSFRQPMVGVWGWQIDYALINPVGGFSGLGLTHQFNCSIFFGDRAQEKNIIRAKKLVEAGVQVRSQGKLKEALHLWEKAAEIMPGDRRLTSRIKALRIAIRNDAEIKICLRQARDFEKKKNYLNAAKEYRRILELVPGHAKAVQRLKKVEAKVKKMSRRQKMLQKQKEQKIAQRLRKRSERKARVVVRKAKQSLAEAEKNRNIKTEFAAELKQLKKQLKQAKELLENGKSEPARILALTVVSKTEKLIRKAAARKA